MSQARSGERIVRARREVGERKVRREHSSCESACLLKEVGLCQLADGAAISSATVRNNIASATRRRNSASERLMHDG